MTINKSPSAAAALKRLIASSRSQTPEPVLDQDSLPIVRRLRDREVANISIPEDAPEPPTWYDLAIEQGRRDRQASHSPNAMPLNGSQVLAAASGNDQPGEVQASVAELIRRMLVTEGRSE